MVAYDAIGGPGRPALVDDSAMDYLQADVRARWLRIPQGVPSWYRYTDFTKKVTSALHRAGVPLMVGTDAMGFPLLTPGSSLHRELQLLVQSGLTPYEAVRAATVVPASFLGRGGGVWHHCRREASGSPAGRRQPSREHRSSADPGRRHGAREVDRSQSVGPDARCSSPSGAPRPLIPLAAVSAALLMLGRGPFIAPRPASASALAPNFPVLARRGVWHSEPGRDPILRRFAHYSPGYRECYEAPLHLDFPSGALAGPDCGGSP